MSDVVISKNIENKITRIVDMLKSTVSGQCAIALAGAHAKGVADIYSDIDLFMFIDKLKPYEERHSIIREFSDAGTTLWVSDTIEYPWGGSMDFYFEGTPVEVTVRTISQLEKRINECLNGHFEIIPQTWTS